MKLKTHSVSLKMCASIVHPLSLKRQLFSAIVPREETASMPVGRSKAEHLSEIVFYAMHVI